MRHSFGFLGLGLSMVLAGCYSDAWIAQLGAGETGEDADTGGGDCEGNDLQCSADGVLRCTEGTLLPDRSNLGCEFAAGSLPQADTDGVQVTIGLANSGMRPANVSLTVAGASVGAITVAPGAAAQLPIPWNVGLGAPAASGVVADATVTVTSDEPISAFLFNRGDAESATSDASTLLPRHVWGDRYFALTHPHFLSPINQQQSPAFWAALSLEPVSLEVSGATALAVAGSGFDQAGNGTASLDSGAAAVVVTASAGTGVAACGWNPGQSFNGCGRPPLQDPSGTYARQCAFLPMEGGACGGMTEYVGCCASDGAAYYCNNPSAGTWVRELCPPLYDASDLSGSQVTGDRPFAFFAGHACSNVPAYEPYCDHLEEQLWPADRSGRSFPVIAPSLDGTPKNYMVRVLALEGAVELSYSPAVAQAPTAISGAGQYVDIHLSTDIIASPNFVLGASGPVQVIALSAGEEGGFGDPAMLQVPSIDQGRRDMAFYVPPGFETISLSVVGPAGTTVNVDGNTTTLMTPLGTEHAMARVGVTQSANGFHRVSADVPVVASVFARNASPEPNSTLWYMAGVDEPKP